jgi:GNAT acetyltransferase-like protein
MLLAARADTAGADPARFPLDFVQRRARRGSRLRALDLCGHCSCCAAVDIFMVDSRRGPLMAVELIKARAIEVACELATEVSALLNDAFPDGAPDELRTYYARHGIPTTSLLLKDGSRVVGHLAVYERRIRIGEDTVLIGLLGEIATATDRRRTGLARLLIGHAHEHLQAKAIPFSILFAFEPRIYLQTTLIDADGQSRTFVFRGSMYAELLEDVWPNLPIDLCGTAV